jgi:hypothetical protein
MAETSFYIPMGQAKRPAAKPAAAVSDIRELMATQDELLAMIDGLTHEVARLAAVVENLAETIAAPKKVIYGPDGETPIGVEIERP